MKIKTAIQNLANLKSLTPQTMTKEPPDEVKRKKIDAMKEAARLWILKQKE